MANKRQALERARLLHPVLSPLFERIVFFDPNDKLQVKYEMLRSHEESDHGNVGTASDF